MCIDNDCDKLAQEDVDALLVLPLSERLRSIDVMKGRSTSLDIGDEDILGDLFDNDKTMLIGLTPPRTMASV